MVLAKDGDIRMKDEAMCVCLSGLYLYFSLRVLRYIWLVSLLLAAIRVCVCAFPPLFFIMLCI